MQNLILLTCSLAMIVWGTGHLLASWSVLKDFGITPKNNKLVAAMGWISEGLLFCFTGTLLLKISHMENQQTPFIPFVLYACMGLFVTLALVSLFSGARTGRLMMKLNPLVKFFFVALLLASVTLKGI